MRPPRKHWKQKKDGVWKDDPRHNQEYINQGKQSNPAEPEWPELAEKFFPSSARGDIPLPSWVARASQAPFVLDNTPGMEKQRIRRANADPLVGMRVDGQRNYNAAGAERMDISTLCFKKRPVLGHYSLYVNGFELDTITKVADASQLGTIPADWLDLVVFEYLHK